MPVIFVKQVAEDKYREETIFFNENELSEEVRAEGILVDSLPPFENIEGKSPILFYSKERDTLWWEYVDRELTESEKLSKLLRDQETMKQALDDLIFGGGF